MITRILMVFLFFLSSRAFSEVALKQDLEECYRTWRAAILTQNDMAWSRVTAPHRQIEVKNRILSEKKRFPQAVFDLPGEPPPIDGLKFLTVKRAGPTARAYYFGGVDFGGGAKSADNLLVLSFIGAGKSWLYDHAEFITLAALPDVRTALAQGDLSYIEQTPEILPSGQIPHTPTEVPEAPFIAKVYAFCPGRDVQVQVNQISRHSFSNDKNAQLVIGGAHSGANQVQYTVKDLDGYEGADPLTVRIYLMSQVDGVKPIKIYEYLVEAGQKPLAFGKGSFTIDAEVKRKLSGEAQ